MSQGQRASTQQSVKSAQDEQMKYQGTTPTMEDRYFHFDACMMNNGAHAQEFAKSLTGTIDHAAFPVRQKPDMSQD